MGQKPKTRPQTVEVENLEKEFKLGFSDELLKVRRMYELNKNNDGVQPTSQEKSLVIPVGVKGTSRKYRVNHVKEILDILDDMNSKGYVQSLLAPLSGIPLETGEYLVISYPAVTQEGFEYLDSKYPGFRLKNEETNAISKK